MRKQFLAEFATQKLLQVTGQSKHLTDREFGLLSSVSCPDVAVSVTAFSPPMQKTQTRRNIPELERTGNKRRMNGFSPH
jgi:hypothetical protein